MESDSLDNERDSDKKEEKEVIQIVFVGPSFVGKTTIINRLLSNYFIKYYHPTSNITKYHINVNIGEGGDHEEEGEGIIPVVLVRFFPYKIF